METFSCLLDYTSGGCELFSVNLIVFAIKNFHEQHYVKDS